MLTIEATPIYGNTAAPFFPTDDVSHDDHHEKWAKEYSGGGACIQSKARATFKQCQIYSNTLRSPNNQQRTGYVAFGAGVAAGGYFGGTAQGQAFFEGCATSTTTRWRRRRIAPYSRRSVPASLVRL